MSIVGRENARVANAAPEMEDKLNSLIERVQTISDNQKDVLERIKGVESNLGSIKKTPASYLARGGGAGAVGITTTRVSQQTGPLGTDGSAKGANLLTHSTEEPEPFTGCGIAGTNILFTSIRQLRHL